MKYGKIESIEELFGFQLGNNAKMNGSNGARLGVMSMLNILGGGRTMDGYRIKTSDAGDVLVCIDDGQSCCERYGYFSSDDDLNQYVGANLNDIELVDTALKVESLKENDLEYGFDGGGIQFVNFKTSKGTFQLAVYNAHNGYYGHGILVAVGENIIHQDTL